MLFMIALRLCYLYLFIYFLICTHWHTTGPQGASAQRENGQWAYARLPVQPGLNPHFSQFPWWS